MGTKSGELNEIVGEIIGKDHYNTIKNGLMTAYLVQSDEGGMPEKFVALGDHYDSPDIGDRVKFLYRDEKIEVTANTMKLIGEEEICALWHVWLYVLEGGEIISEDACGQPQN